MPEDVPEDVPEAVPEVAADAPPLRDEAVPVEILSSDLMHGGMVWNVVRERFSYGDHEITREFIDHPGAVAILAMDADDRILVIQQYRHPIREREWELPAGLLDIEGEDPMEAARRELGEEADLEAAELSLLVDFHTSPGGSNERLRIYLARGLTATATAYDRFDEEADIVTRWVALDDVVAAVLDGRLRNSILIVAVLAAQVRAHAGR
jgi:8-oxo-dGDP phosphatase